MRQRTMSFVYFESFDGVSGVPVLELVLVLGIPESPIVDRRDIEVLGDASNPCRYTVDRLARKSCHGNLDHGVVRNWAYPRLGRRDIAFPYSKSGFRHWIRCV